MRLSTRGRYAVMAMVELAARQSGLEAAAEAGSGRAQISLSEIAQAQHLSLAYLEQLFGPLRRAGLVASARGPGGGYRLARPAGQISISEIVLAVDEPLQATRCEEGGPGCLAGQRCLTHDLWAELGDQIRLFLEGLTLADVIGRQVSGRAAPPRSIADAAEGQAQAAQ
ncbi:Rrf2 family transcriptional regulator [Falsiroseomonas oryzae]|uniref:Rrf2 family transcriptional regulator n=1 Tax=Falsiroseomonas oryzae TaxID=2766473 RepID=UPI0022EAB648|nr:Rrf2 family transcriptional regulator [Roseomonas sp. MO-31]